MESSPPPGFVAAMKLVIFGLTISSSWGNGHATLWRGLCKALIRRGHEVVFFERDVPWYAEARDMSELPGGELILYSDWETVLPLARRHVADADAAMTTSYCIDALNAAALLADAPRALKTFYDLDTPVTFARLDAGEAVPYLPPEGLGRFDLVLSYTGGPALAALRDRLGARNVAPLYGSVDPEVHAPAAPVDWYKADLSYLGTYAADRQAALENLFIEPARRLSERRFLIGGAQYPQDFPWTRNIYFVKHVPPPDHPAFYSSGRMTLNVTRASMAAMGWCPSGRLFEAAACGTPILSDSWDGLDAFFVPDREILVADGPEDTIAAMERSDHELRRIAEAARERALAEHSADARARELEALLEDAASGATAGPLEAAEP